MCEKYLYGSEGGAGNDRPYPYREAPGWLVKHKQILFLSLPCAPQPSSPLSCSRSFS